MTSHGSAYARFRRALATGNLTMIRAAAAELPQVSLSDALQVCWAIRHGEAGLYERACVRWLARFCAEAQAVTLPDVRAAAAALGDLRDPHPFHSAATDDGCMVRVLICDDVAELRALIRLALADCEGVDVVAEAANGAEAVDLVEVDAPDVVLLDLTMPVMSGLEALPRLRQVAPETKVVIYSGFVTEAVEAQALSLGASRCVSKSEGVREVCAAVRALGA